MNITLRTATPDDAEEVATLVNTCYRGDSSRKGWTSEDHLMGGGRIHAQGVRDVLSHTGTVVLLCEIDGHLSGCVELSLRGDQMYLGMLAVRPELQASGIGSRLLAAGEERGRMMGCRSMTMLVIEHRHDLIAWYGRKGYSATGEYRPFTNTDPAFGIPKVPLRFAVLEKSLS